MNDKAVCRTAPAIPSLLNIGRLVCLILPYFILLVEYKLFQIIFVFTNIQNKKIKKTDNVRESFMIDFTALEIDFCTGKLFIFFIYFIIMGQQKFFIPRNLPRFIGIVWKKPDAWPFTSRLISSLTKCHGHFLYQLGLGSRH